MALSSGMPDVQIILCIPGRWEAWESFLRDLVVSSEGTYFALGNILMEVAGEAPFTTAFHPHDDRMRDAFASAGSVTRISKETLAAIDEHASVIYLIGPGGSAGAAESIAYAAAAVLRAGGLGVKVETAGKAFSPEDWHRHLAEEESPALYPMFVVDSITDESGAVYSCGMHNLGLKDTIVGGADFQASVDLISAFSYYQLVDAPTITSGQTFSVDAEAPVYRIAEEKSQPSAGYELFENPYGVWRLTRV